MQNSNRFMKILPKRDDWLLLHRQEVSNQKTVPMPAKAPPSSQIRTVNESKIAVTPTSYLKNEHVSYFHSPNKSIPVTDLDFSSSLINSPGISPFKLLESADDAENNLQPSILRRHFKPKTPQTVRKFNRSCLQTPILRDDEQFKLFKTKLFSPIDFLASPNLSGETKTELSSKKSMLLSTPSKQSAVQLDLKWEMIVCGKTKDQLEMTSLAKTYLKQSSSFKPRSLEF